MIMSCAPYDWVCILLYVSDLLCDVSETEHTTVECNTQALSDHQENLHILFQGYLWYCNKHGAHTGGQSL